MPSGSGRRPVASRARGDGLSSPLWQQLIQASRALRTLLQVPEPTSAQLGALTSLDAAATDLLYAGLRSWGLSRVRLRRLVAKKPAPPIECLLAVAFSCLRRDYRPAGVVVDQTVRAARQLGGLPATAFVNAVLRRALSESDAAADDEAHPEARWNAPDWWRQRLVDELGADLAEAVLTAQQQHPPFTLRVLLDPDARADWQAAIEASGRSCHWLSDRAVVVQPAADPTTLPGYGEGAFRVQDWSSQQMLGLLPLGPGQQVLDACAAPGGKGFLALEQAKVTVWAMDLSEGRLDRLRAEWHRLEPRLLGRLEVRQADLLSGWPDDAPEAFDHIILDAPCTGSGVVRRHPEIPWRRSPEQLAQAVVVQSQLLERLWKRLKPGGECLYMTCSIFDEEGEGQMRRFLAAHPDAERLPAPGRLLPDAIGSAALPLGGLAQDGFFFGRLRRRG